MDDDATGCPTFPNPPGASRLHVFDNAFDLVAASDADDAAEVLRETYGADTTPGGTVFSELADDRPLKIGGVTKTAAEWAAEGRAFLGSSDF